MFYTYVERVGNKILHIGYKNGKKFIKKENFIFKLALEDEEGKFNTGWKTIYGKPVYFKEFEKFWDAKEYYDKYKNFIKIHNYISPEIQFISEKYSQKIEYNVNDVRIWFYDIEVYSEKGFAKPENPTGEIVSIAIYDSKEKEYYIFTLKPFETKPFEKEHKVKVNHLLCSDEKELLIGFMNLIQELKPDIITGYFSEIFDNPYIVNRIKFLFGEEALNNLSPIKRGVKVREKKLQNGKVIYNINIPGITLIDYVELIKKYFVNSFESYSLDFISKTIIKDEKIKYEEFDNINDFYRKNPQMYFEYNLQDTRLLVKLEEKLKFIELLMSIAYMAKSNFNDVLGTIKVWDAFVYNILKEKKIVIPPEKEHNSCEDYPGAYVHNPKPGLYEWILSFDLNSLYPHIIMQWNISPECFIEKERLSVNQEEIDKRLLKMEIDLSEYRKKNYAVAGNGCLFDTSRKGFVAKIMEDVYKTRKAVKKKMLDMEKEIEKLKNNLEENHHKIQRMEEEANQLNLQQMALKVLLNSFYGAYANRYFRYYDLRFASAITLSGQWAIKHMMRWLNGYFQKKFNYKPVIYADTDSIYLNLKPLVDKKFKGKGTKEEITHWLEKLALEKIQPLIEKGYKKLQAYTGCLENKMVMKLEKISYKGLWKAKKKYAILALYEEGVYLHEPELKVTGIEIKRSSTPALVKDMLKEIVILIMKKPELVQEKIAEFKKKFMNANYKDIAFPRGATDVRKYTISGDNFKSGTPIHIRGAIVYNRYIDKKGLNLPKIDNGDKIKFLYLIEPNPLNSYVISFPKRLPDENLIKYVDYEKMWEKAFLQVVNDILNAIGKEELTSKKTNLMDFF